MFFSPQRLPVSWLSVCIALIGAAYCGLQVAPVPFEVPCPGTGCHLFQDFFFYGISLWWVGVAYFAFMALACFRRAQMLALTVAGLALCADGVLLVIMLFTAACVTCLGAAALMGVLFFILRRHVYSKSPQPAGPSFVLLAWGGLFIAALALAGTEQVRPWHIAGTEQMERRVYFSPSCPACRDAITVFADQAMFIPVAERESDYPAIFAMQRALESGKNMPEALAAAQNPPAYPALSLENAMFRLRLLRNKAEVLRLGFDQLPLIMINGMPQAMRPAARPSAQPSSALPPELTTVDSCGGQNPEPCDPPR
ncbi:hypothetical protein LJC26_08605 [Desulfovibrio sp. OttesenSCG-928-O18]|nr:hypothetical protein [Desulfovibrio sp. OttesenSCG-928-O18]